MNFENAEDTITLEEWINISVSRRPTNPPHQLLHCAVLHSFHPVAYKATEFGMSSLHFPRVLYPDSLHWPNDPPLPGPHGDGSSELETGCAAGSHEDGLDCPHP